MAKTQKHQQLTDWGQNSSENKTREKTMQEPPNVSKLLISLLLAAADRGTKTEQQEPS